VLREWATRNIATLTHNSPAPIDRCGALVAHISRPEQLPSLLHGLQHDARELFSLISSEQPQRRSRGLVAEGADHDRWLAGLLRVRPGLAQQ
jgi:hypothetical protein